MFTLLTLLLRLQVSAQSESQTQKLLLVPKTNTFFTDSNLDAFGVEHNLETVVSFDSGLTIYSTTVDNFNSFANTLSELFYIEEDQTISVSSESVIFQKSSDLVPWHLNRVIKRKLSESVPWSAEVGSCHSNPNVSIHSYVIDTGIDVSHPQFEGRAEWLANFVGDEQDFDGNNHGTHCGGLIGSRNYGTCRDAKLFAVKVLDSSGSGTLSGVLKGVEFAFNRHLLLSKDNANSIRSIISMSLGSSYSRAVNSVMESCLKNSDTFYIVVAAGNEDADACNTSPASAEGVMTVMAMGNDDSRAYFSNYGKCADVYSPGVDVMSAIPGGKTAVYSGTSQATPIVAGIMNHYLNKFPELNMKELKKKILSDSTKNVISKNPKNTNNYLVYMN